MLQLKSKLKRQELMLNDQCSMINECTNSQYNNALNHCYIDNSLKIDCCKLIIATGGRV